MTALEPVVILGAGGFGRECHDIITEMNSDVPRWDFRGLFDDREPGPDLLKRRTASWLGPVSQVDSHSGAHFVAAVADPVARERLVGVATAAGLEPATLMHPSAVRGGGVDVGQGSVICSHATITTDVSLGRFAQIHINCAIGHDVVADDFVTVLPSATIGGGVRLRARAVVGSHGTVVQGLGRVSKVLQPDGDGS